MDLDAEIDRLYGTPLDEFVAERDKLAKRLRADGEREEADRVKKLRKPSAGAWALNQAVRRRRKETDALLAAGEKLREAHEELLGGGDVKALRDAMQEERALASALADCAETIASETGKSGPALRERVRSTLHAATVDEEAREELTRGRVVREREAVGLGPFDAAALPIPARGGKKAAKGAGDAEGAGDAAKGAADDARGADARGKRGRGAAGAAADGKRGGGAAGGDGAGAKRGRASRKRSAADREKAAARERAEREKAAERERAELLAAAEGAVDEARAALEEAEEDHSDAAGELQAAREAVGAAEDAEREARAVARERKRALGKLERELDRLKAKSAKS